MISAFHPEVNKIYPFEHYTILWLQGGQSVFQIDFRNYQFTGEKIIFLSPGQYFRLLQGNLDIQKMNLSSKVISANHDTRFLFKHIISLGHIELHNSDQNLLSSCPASDIDNSMRKILQQSIHQWLTQNPFRVSLTELDIIFKLKEIVDATYNKQVSVPQIISALPAPPIQVNALVKYRLNLTINKLLQNKLALEARREVAFTDKTTKEIAYDLGFNDPKYFNRFFKTQTTQTPGEFRDHFGYETTDPFISELLVLIDEHYKVQHSTIFYANAMFMSIKTLAKKTKEKLNATVGELIREKLLAEAKRQLRQDKPVKEIAFDLGFEEANHFTTYFKHYTNITPTDFRLSLQKSAPIVE